MADKTPKTVLVVDDEERMRTLVKDGFLDLNHDPNAPYTFTVDESDTVSACVKKIRQRMKTDQGNYDVLILDIRLNSGEEGLLLGSLAVAEQFGDEKPVRIIFTGFRNEEWLRLALRSGVWDYIVKEDTHIAGKPVMAAQRLTASAVFRLRQIDTRRKQERRIGGQWLDEHFDELRREYCGKLVALWHEPEITILADGQDAFELEENLKDWRSAHTWEQPFIVQVTP